MVIGGSIAPRGDGYEIAIEATDAVTGELLGEQDSRAGSRDEVLPAIGELVVRLRRRLGDAVPDAAAAAREETFTAGSLEAAQNYARAQDLMASGSWRDSVPLYQKAVELDPDFGRAYAGLGAVYFNLGEAKEAEDYYQQALSQIDRMTERERYRTRAGYYLRVGSWDSAVEELQALVDNYPADEAGLSNLALANFFARNFEEALEGGRQAVETYPNNTLSRANLALYAMYAGDFETAEEEAVQVITENPAYETAYVALAMAEIDGGDIGAASEWYRQLRTVSTRGSSIANLGEADLALYRGDLAEAARLLEGGIVADTASDQTSMAQIKQVKLAVTRQQLGNALDLPQLELLLQETQSSRVRFEAALLLAAAGEGERARELGEEIAATGSNDAMAMKHLIDGEVSLRDDSALAAIQSFQEARRLADSWLARYGLGRAHLSRASYAEAHSELDRCYTRRGEATAIFFDDLPSYHYMPPLQYYLGRALEGLGSDGAIDEYRRFLAIRGGAEDDPLVIEARARIEALAAQ